MNLQPLLSAPAVVQMHVLTVLPAFVLGLWMLFASRKGSPLHRAVGRVYLALMTITSVVALFVHQTNPDGPFGFSWIHLLVPLTLFGVVRGLLAARRGNVIGHRWSMISVFVGGILIAGGLAFDRGRIMHSVVFGD